MVSFNKIVFVATNTGIATTILIDSGQHRTGALRPVFSYKLRYIVGFGLGSTIYRNLYENAGPDADKSV